jgi:uncharacterized protein YecT (DUF1311 family)
MKNLICISFLFFTLLSFSQTGETELSIQYKKADKELNKVYSTLKNKLGDIDKKALIEAQKAWIKYRDLNCKFISQESSEGGIIANKMKIDCLTEMTMKRTKELKEQITEF